MTADRSGTIRYTERAFEQDADLAMGTDIVRALVELITNSDDAYGDLPGAIAVEVHRGPGSPARIVVTDRAKGLSPQELETHFGVLGLQTSGHTHGAPVRGLFGRGAKDTAAFGRTIFEAVKDGAYGRFELARSGSWTLSERRAEASDYAALQLSPDGSGLRATVVVERTGIPIPNRDELARRLSRHVQLRDLTRQREVTLRYVNADVRGPSLVLRWDEPAGEEVIDTMIDVSGYGVSAKLRLVRLNSPSPDRLDVYSSHGVVIRGAATSFTNTMFGQAGPETSWIHGSLDCPDIDRLIKEFDEHSGNDPMNPSRLLRRDRDGLVVDHPFYTALSTAVLDVLAPILEDLRPRRDSVGGSERLRDELRRAGRAVENLLRADLQRLDGETDASGTRPSIASPILVIPPRVAVRVGGQRTLTVLLFDSAVRPESTVSVVISDESIIEMLGITARVPHSTMEGVSVLNVRVGAKTLGSATVTVVDDESTRGASSEIRVHDDEHEPDQPPETLEWIHPQMSVGVGKSRSGGLRAPIQLAPNGALTVQVRAEGDGCEVLDREVVLRLTADGWLEGRCRLKGETLDSTTTLFAEAGGDTASAAVRVTRPTALSGANLDFEIVDKLQGHVRGTLRETETGHRAEIYAQHQVLAALLGRRNEDGSWEGERSPAARMAVAEAFATTVVDWLIRFAAGRSPHLYSDAEAVLSERSKQVNRYLIPLARVLLAEESAQ